MAYPCVCNPAMRRGARNWAACIQASDTLTARSRLHSGVVDISVYLKKSSVHDILSSSSGGMILEEGRIVCGVLLLA